MKVITASTDPNRKLVAVVGVDNMGLFFRPYENEPGHCFLSTSGRVFYDAKGDTLEKVLEDHKDRRPVYAGGS